MLIWLVTFLLKDYLSSSRRWFIREYHLPGRVSFFSKIVDLAYSGLPYMVPALLSLHLPGNIFSVKFLPDPLPSPPWSAEERQESFLATEIQPLAYFLFYLSLWSAYMACFLFMPIMKCLPDLFPFRYEVKTWPVSCLSQLLSAYLAHLVSLLFKQSIKCLPRLFTV